MMSSRLAAVVATAMLLPLAGCYVQTNKNAGGKNDNVDIRTPLGSMSVKTDSTAVAQRIGLPIYPGAVPEQKKADDSGSADVNMNFGPFHLRVLAQSYTTPDDTDKVRAFYKKSLAQYGDVIECKDKQPVNGSHARTGQGLTCDEGNHVKAKDKEFVTHDDDFELKAGSKSHQHVVGFQARDGGTKFDLVVLELPGGDDSDQPN